MIFWKEKTSSYNRQNTVGGLSLPRESVVRLTDPADMATTVYGGRKTTVMNHIAQSLLYDSALAFCLKYFG